MPLFKKLFGDDGKRMLKNIQPLVDCINNLEDSVSDLSSEALSAKTSELKKRLVEGETLEDILPEAFALVRETAKRELG
tara:strand:- start:954 stop:1190 length:237 start_codon:yes stop_codon:yes gene_type:complete